MSELTVSCLDWLAISLRNGNAILFNLNDLKQWQSIQIEVNHEKTSTKTKHNTNDDDNDDDDGGNDLNRNLIKFTPNGQTLIINGQNKQIYVYVLIDNQQTNVFWKLKRTITVIKRASAIDLTNHMIFIADKSGDVYKEDLLADDDRSLTHDDCIMGHLSMLLDVAYIKMNENQQYLLTTDRDEKIRLTNYPNSYNIEGYCLGHREFVSHIKLIDRNHIISSSGDGTIRLWHLPDCIELNSYQSKDMISSAKQISYEIANNQSSSDCLSKPIDFSIWKIDVTSISSNIFLALSIYAHRSHSIYLLNINNNDRSITKQFQLTFDKVHGTIIDYYFLFKENQCQLFILFESSIVFQININSFFFNEKNIIDENDNIIRKILSLKDYNIICNLTVNEIIFKQLFKTRGNPEDSSYYKRKNQRIQQQEEKRQKKQTVKT